MTAAELKAKTDRYGGMYEALAAALVGIGAKMQADTTAVYGDGTAQRLPLSDPNAINALGPAALKSAAFAGGAGPYASLLAGNVTALSSYLQRQGPLAGPAGVRDVASLLRAANGCPNPTPAGNGAGSSFQHLAHPSYAALVSLISGGGSVLPPDAVFAPTGAVLGRFHAGDQGGAVAGTYAAGMALMTTAAPYAPAGPGQFVVRAGNAASLTAPAPGQPAPALSGEVPNGSLFLVITGLNQAGHSVTWRGDCGTGLAALGQTLPAATLLDASGGVNGGTAAPGDRLVGITGIALDGARASTATQGDIDIITLAERPAI